MVVRMRLFLKVTLKKFLKIFNKAKKKLVIIKNGDHSLSNKQALKRIEIELHKIVSNII